MTMLIALYTERASDDDFDLLCVVDMEHEHGEELVDRLRQELGQDGTQVRSLSASSLASVPDVLDGRSEIFNSPRPCFMCGNSGTKDCYVGDKWKDDDTTTPTGDAIFVQLCESCYGNLE